MSPYKPEQVMPQEVRPVVSKLGNWFVIGGNAVRCLCPYRPTRDIDFGVDQPKSLGELLRGLEQSGTTEILQKSSDTVDLRWNGIAISIFVLEEFVQFTTERRLTVEGILATKLHAILDRGTRRDFFDLYVVLQHEQRGIAECLSAMRTVYGQPINDSLLLRALTYFVEADAEAPLPNEGERDWRTVKEFFITRVGHLLVPPAEVLEIQQQIVDVSED